MKTVSLRAYLTRLIWLCVLPLVLLTFYLALDHVGTLQVQRNREAAGRVHDVVIAIDRQIGTQIAALQLLAASPLLDDSSRLREFHKEARGFRENFGGHVILADLSMQMLLNTRVPFGTILPKLPQPKGHAAAPAVLATGKPAVGDMFPGPIAKETLVAVVVPVIRGGTRFLLLSTIETRQFQRLIDDVSLPPGWTLTLLDGKSEVMARRASVRSEGGPGGEEMSRRFVTNSAVAPWSVVLEIPRSVYRAPIVSAAVAFAVAILAVTLISILVGSQAGRRLARSVATLTATRSSESPRPVIAEIEEIRGILADAGAVREVADSARRESAELFSATFEQAAVGIAHVAPDGRWLRVNQKMCDIVGYPSEELLAKAFQDITHPEDIEADLGYVRQVLADEIKTYSLMKRYFRKDGSIVWINLTVSLVRNDLGQPKYFISVVEDITDRKQAESALRESEANLRQAQGIARIGSWTSDLSGRMVWSDEMYRIYGISPEAFTPDDGSFMSLIHPDDRPVMQAWIQACIAGEKPGELEFRTVLPDGTVRVISGRGELISDADGKPTHLAGTAQDITERRRAEAALAEKESQYRDLVENSNDLICTHDLNGTILSVNPAAVKALGYPADELLRMNLRDILSPEKLDRLAIYLHRLRRRGMARGLMFVRTAAGAERIWDYDNTLRTEGVPAPVVRGMARDVTEQKQAEEKLSKSEEEFRRLSQEFQGLLNAIPDSLMLLDADLKVLWANRAAVEAIGGTPEGLDGRYCYALWYNRSAACDPCPVERSFATGQPQSETVTRSDGRIWDIRTVPLVDAQGRTTRVIEVKRNITEHRRLEEQLRHAQKLEGIGQLAGGIAHDFNNVLGAVMGFAGVLQMRMSEGDPLRHYTDELVAAGERGANLTRQILAFSRKQVFDLKPVRLNGIVRGLEKMLRRLLPESIDISQDLHKEDPVVLVDTGQIEQVLLNLATNARDAIAGIGRIGIATERFTMDRSFVELHGYGEPGEYAVLTVSDTGRGMDAATRMRVFEPFFTTKEIGKGTGLGLAVVHGIVKQHRGFINVYSELGKGTVIRVYLPLAVGAVSEKTAAEPQARVPGGSETILVAEDDAVLRKLTRTVLSQYGYTVIEAEDGDDAIAKFAENQDTIRLVILDGLMPKKGGVEALEGIRKLCPGIKAIFMSGYANDIFSGGGLRDKAAAFIQKPVMPADLLRTVREVLDR